MIRMDIITGAWRVEAQQVSKKPECVEKLKTSECGSTRNLETLVEKESSIYETRSLAGQNGPRERHGYTLLARLS